MMKGMLTVSYSQFGENVMPSIADVDSLATRLMYFDLWFSFLSHLSPVLSTVKLTSIADVLKRGRVTEVSSRTLVTVDTVWHRRMRHGIYVHRKIPIFKHAVCFRAFVYVHFAYSILFVIFHFRN